jgi:hypothetical protein
LGLAAPLVRFGPLKTYPLTRPRLSGSPRGAHWACFHARKGAWLANLLLSSYAYNLRLLLQSLLLFRVPSLPPPLLPFGESTTYQGFGPPSTTHTGRPLTRSPSSASFRPQALAASRRVTPPHGLQACFIPQPSPGPIPVQGFVLLAQPPSLIGRSCPLAVGVGPLTHEWAATDPDPSTSRLCSVQGRQSTGSVVSLPGDRSPPRVLSLLQALLLPLVPRDQTSMAFPSASSTKPKLDRWCAQPAFDAFTTGGLLSCLQDNDLPELLEPSRVARFFQAAKPPGSKDQDSRAAQAKPTSPSLRSPHQRLRPLSGPPAPRGRPPAPRLLQTALQRHRSLSGPPAPQGPPIGVPAPSSRSRRHPRSLAGPRAPSEPRSKAARSRAGSGDGRTLRAEAHPCRTRLPPRSPVNVTRQLPIGPEGPPLCCRARSVRAPEQRLATPEGTASHRTDLSVGARSDAHPTPQEVNELAATRLRATYLARLPRI